MSPQLVLVTYLDPCFEFEEGELSTPCIKTVVGWDLPGRWPGWCAVASEQPSEGFTWRAVTHIPLAAVAQRVELEVP